MKTANFTYRSGHSCTHSMAACWKLDILPKEHSIQPVFTCNKQSRSPTQPDGKRYVALIPSVQSANVAWKVNLLTEESLPAYSLTSPKWAGICGFAFAASKVAPSERSCYLKPIFIFRDKSRSRLGLHVTPKQGSSSKTAKNDVGDNLARE
jgi:hypothetical protein